MKTFNKLLILLVSIVVISINPLRANDTIRTRQQMTLDIAEKIIRTTLDPQLQRLAVRVIIQNAKSANPKAMHLMGMLCSRRVVVTKDLNRAHGWFIAANANGYLKSAYNLSMMYRLGLGVKQDFTKAYEYICRAGEQGDSLALYGRGYFLYKGLGCQQDYKKALSFFLEAADKGHPRSMYMLGLMYRNNYGVDRDPEIAKYWFAKAADFNVKSALEEMSLSEAENPIRPTRLKVASHNNSVIENVPLARVKHSISSSSSILGKYSGTLVTYDYSGQYVIRECPLEVTIEQSDDGMIAHWKEDTLTNVTALCHLTDSALVFSQATYSKSDRYHPTKPVEWNFVKATLSTKSDSSGTTLTGNLQLYSPGTGEPEKPMYLTLHSATNNTLLSYKEVNGVRIYPNPVISQLYISFEMPNPGRCSVEIYTLYGQKVYENNLGKIDKGSFHYQIPLELSPGAYTVKLNYGDKRFTAVIIKK